MDEIKRKLKPGMEVRIHPATDQFMMGFIYTTVKAIGRKWIKLYHHGSRTTKKFNAAYAREYFMTIRGEMMFEQTPASS